MGWEGRPTAAVKDGRQLCKGLVGHRPAAIARAPTSGRVRAPGLPGLRLQRRQRIGRGRRHRPVRKGHRRVWVLGSLSGPTHPSTDSWSSSHQTTALDIRSRCVEPSGAQSPALRRQAGPEFRVQGMIRPSPSPRPSSNLPKGQDWKVPAWPGPGRRIFPLSACLATDKGRD